MTTTSNTLQHPRWGRGQDGNWHLVPYISMNDDHYVWYDCPTGYVSMLVAESHTYPPEGATLCPHCRGMYTAKLVEET